MSNNKRILAINGSSSKDSSNLKLIHYIKDVIDIELDWVIYDDLAVLPHFKPELSSEGTPEEVIKFRSAIENANVVVISSPEYVFSIPSGLKNALEWCVSTTVFSRKPVGLITASSSGLKAHDDLQLIMKTIEAVFNDDTTLLISGVKGKMDKEGNVNDANTKKALSQFNGAIKRLILPRFGKVK